MSDRAVVLTFDNLGEASELERGTWPAGEPLGRHPSVTQILPRLLDELDAHCLTATFFAEGISRELYPDALREIGARGHELGVHGWRHESWAELAPARERELLVRADRAFRELGLAPRGFRPPGGTGTAETTALLGELGYTWWSPAASGAALGEVPGLAQLAFDWELVDAYHLMESFAELRAARRDRRETMAPGELGDRIAERLSHGSGTDVLVLHPFLMVDDAWWAQVSRLLRRLGALRRSGRAFVGPGAELK
jgi:peptidoglycan/xylan/chitin deacetylase (PgdA/CDA1 family)